MRRMVVVGVAALTAGGLFAEHEKTIEMMDISDATCAGLAAWARDPVDWVNTGIGSVSHMLVPTFRTVQRPNALFRFNGPAGSFVEDRVRTCHLFVPGHRDPGVFPFHPKGGDADAPFCGTWDQEHATPYSYDVYLDGEAVRMSVAPGEKAGLFVFDFERPGPHALVFSAKDRVRGRVTVRGCELDGLDVYGNYRGDIRADVFLRGSFDVEPTGVRTAGGRTVVSFPEKPCTVRLRVAFSYLSPGQAARNLAAEIPDFDFARVAGGAREAWNRTLGQVAVEGGTDNERTVFYTALWRTYERMVNVTEDGRYRGFDGKVHDAGGSDYYVDDWSWDTYRAAHPLMAILRPKEEGDKMQSYVRMGEQNREGWMPVFPCIAGDRHSMVNRHPSVMMLDAWRKGVRNFDARRAFEIIDRTEETESLVPWYRGPLTELDVFYKAHGYYPGLRTNETEWVEGVDRRWEHRQCVSVTQGAALDAWAIAEFGRELGIDAARLEKYDARAKGYRALWNPKTQFFHPKDAEGRFIEPFDYMLCGGDGARHYYTENNAWTYIWDVQHDIPGLVALFGGAAQMEAKLDRMFNASVGSRWRFAGQMPDSCTGLMGVFTMANEPSFHIPYLYNYCGKPEKTQKLVRKTLEAWFRNDRMGMCGDEDGGGMSAYAVFSMMGFYPVTPGLPEYQWGSPVFRKVTIALESGRTFVLEAPEASEDAKYIHGITVDGVRTRGALEPLRHADLVRGAHVVVEMDRRPGKAGEAERIPPKSTTESRQGPQRN